MSPGASRSPALPRPERERRVLDAAEALFYARGVHAVEMDELVHAIFAAVEDDLARPGFRGCAFNNAGVEFGDPEHPGAPAGRAGPADGGGRRG